MCRLEVDKSAVDIIVIKHGDLRQSVVAVVIVIGIFVVVDSELDGHSDNILSAFST